MKNTSHKQLKLYKVDMKYIRDLHKVDDRVYSVSPQIGKESRPYIGIVVVCKNKKYIVPLTSPKEKYKNKDKCVDFEKVYDKNGKWIAVLKFSHMIPVEQRQLSKIDLKIKINDSKKVRNYKELCINEINYCRKPEISKVISDKANAIYDLCTSNSNYKRKDKCLNFAKLEDACKKYNEKLKKRNGR